jgi:hypothetical protein
MVSRCQINGRTETRPASDSSLRANESAQSTARRPHRSPRVRDLPVRSPVPHGWRRECRSRRRQAAASVSHASGAGPRCRTHGRASQSRAAAADPQLPGTGPEQPGAQKSPHRPGPGCLSASGRITHRRTSEAASLQSLPAARDRARERRCGRRRWPISPGRWSCNARCRRENPDLWR